MSTLFVVGTPIGNLEDITIRALRVLGEVDRIFCEDTRVSRKLLAAYQIKTPLESLNTRTERQKVKRALSLLSDGKSIALISDAGTPTISDPGSYLVRQVQERLGTEAVVAIPGASALVAALSVSGVPSSEFVFLGFLPHKKGKEKLLKEIGGMKRPVVFYESPHRIVTSLHSLSKYIENSRRVVLCRELTKFHEEVLVGTVGELAMLLEQEPVRRKGEHTVIIDIPTKQSLSPL